MVSYTLRVKGNPSLAGAPADIIGEAPTVNTFVVLKAAGGRGAELVEEIRYIAGLNVPFNDRRIVDFCVRYQVTEERHKDALNDLLNRPKDSLILVDEDTKETWEVKQQSSIAGKKWIWLRRILKL